MGKKKHILKENTILVLGEYDTFVADLCEHWSNLPYCELSVIASALRALAAIHQSHHWQASGDPSYGDHLLYDRLYYASNEHVDQVAEKAVGLGGEDLVCPVKLSEQTFSFVQQACSCNTNGIYMASEIALTSYEAEKHFLNLLSKCIDSLRASQMMTNGIENMLQGIADIHESHVYLLGQRTKH